MSSSALITTNPSINKNSLMTKFLTIILFLYFINFLDKDFFIPLLLFPVVWIYMLKMPIYKPAFYTVIILMIFGVVYSFMLGYYNFGWINLYVMLIFYPSVLFMMGYYFGEIDNDYRFAYKMIFLLIFSFTLFAFLSYLKTSIMYGGYDNYVQLTGKRAVISIWSNRVISATGLNTYLSLGLTLLPVLLYNKIGKKLKLLMLLCFSFCIYTIIQMGSRTGFLIVGCAFISIYLFSQKLSISKLKRFFTFTIIIIMCLILYTFNFLGVKNFYEDSFLFHRFTETEAVEDPRLEAWGDAFKGLWENPLGGRQTNLNLSLAHNMWLDVGYDAGIFPVILLVVFTFVSLIALYKFIRSEHPLLLKSLLIGLYTAFFIQFMMEPILQGWFAYFFVFCFITGLVMRMNFELKLKKKKEKLQ